MRARDYLVPLGFGISIGLAPGVLLGKTWSDASAFAGAFLGAMVTVVGTHLLEESGRLRREKDERREAALLWREIVVSQSFCAKFISETLREGGIEVLISGWHHIEKAFQDLHRVTALAGEQDKPRTLPFEQQSALLTVRSRLGELSCVRGDIRTALKRSDELEWEDARTLHARMQHAVDLVVDATEMALARLEVEIG